MFSLFFTENVEYGNVFPLLQVAYVGDTVKIYCQSLTLPIFTLNNSPVEFEHVVEEGKLILYNVQLNQSGTYVCKGKHEDEDYFWKSSNPVCRRCVKIC